MTVRVGINGFGRIGRNLFRAARQRGADIDFVAVNDLGSLETMAHLLKYDSVLGQLPQTIKATKNGIKVGDDELQVLSGAQPGRAAVGRPRRRPRRRVDRHLHVPSKAAVHLEAGAPLVIVSAPCDGADAHVRVRRQPHDFDPKKHKVVSNASCTTNCFVPMVKVLDDAFGIEQGLMTTIHAYTGDQQLVDGPHSDLRRARAAAINIVPTSTGAARATSLVLESMKGKLDGTSLRVPVPDRFDHRLQRRPRQAGPRVAEINAAFAKAAKRARSRACCATPTEPIVSSDIQRRPALVHLRLAAHDEHGQAGQGARLVRQRVGLLQPPRRLHAVHRHEAAGRSRKKK